MNRTRMVAVVGAVVLAVAISACGGPPPVSLPAGSTMDRLHKAGTIRIGVKFDQPGLGFRNPTTGDYEGFDIEMAKIIAARLGLAARQITYIPTISQNREPYLTGGNVDIVIASYSITEARRRLVGQAGPYYVTGQQLLVRTRDKDRIGGPGDVAGVRVCSVAGSTSARVVQAGYGAELVSVDSYSTCVRYLLDGTVDAVTTDGAILHSFANQQPNNLAVVGEQFNSERYGIGYRKGDNDFCRFLTAAIQQAIDSGAWQVAFDHTLGKLGAGPPSRPTLDPCPP